MRFALLFLCAGLRTSSAFNFAVSSADRSACRGTRSTKLIALGGLFEMLNPKKTFAAPCVMGEESIMGPKEHGTSTKPVQSKLRWGCKEDLADRICSYNRHYAENGGYWERSTTFLSDEEQSAGDTTFYDSVTGKPLFYAGKERSWEVFVKESKSHGWPSFRDSEVNWDYVRVLPDGECVSVDGTHLGHNLPDRSGNRYCINLVSVAGLPEDGK
jgi:peptide methionine sulfoxide reductase MsrB